jgi:DNA-directed RNA polymerase specialized sigma24 family protein
VDNASVRRLGESIARKPKIINKNRSTSEKRERVEIELADLPTRLPPDDLLALDEAPGRLEQLDPVEARLVILRYFSGMTIEQAAERP